MVVVHKVILKTNEKLKLLAQHQADSALNSGFITLYLTLGKFSDFFALCFACV